jgi:hypothetical protein
LAKGHTHLHQGDDGFPPNGSFDQSVPWGDAPGYGDNGPSAKILHDICSAR